MSSAAVDCGIGNTLPAAGVWETRELFLRHECEAGDGHAEAFEAGASQGEVDLGAVVADAGDLVDQIGTGGNDARALPKERVRRRPSPAVSCESEQIKSNNRSEVLALQFGVLLVGEVGEDAAASPVGDAFFEVGRVFKIAPANEGAKLSLIREVEPLAMKSALLRCSSLSRNVLVRSRLFRFCGQQSHCPRKCATRFAAAALSLFARSRLAGTTQTWSLAQASRHTKPTLQVSLFRGSGATRLAASRFSSAVASRVCGATQTWSLGPQASRQT
jgi:hypothetical protein